jgi:hypothetical protein
LRSIRSWPLCATLAEQRFRVAAVAFAPQMPKNAENPFWINPWKGANVLQWPLFSDLSFHA